MKKQRFLTTALLLAAAIGGCDSVSHNDNPPSLPTGAPSSPLPASVPEFALQASDVTGAPIAGALVTITDGNALFEATTDATGRASLAGAPSGALTMSVTAPGFEPWATAGPVRRDVHRLTLNAVGAWAVGRAIALGAHMLERAADGSALTFSVDVAVIGADSSAIETLTSADFEVFEIDCGWGGPRDCASDAAGNATGQGGGNFARDGGAESFALQPSSPRRPYLVSVLAERSRALQSFEDNRASALKSFFATLGGNDLASLAAVESIGGTPTLTVFGPFTSNGRSYFDAIDGLVGSAADEPAIPPSLLESISRAAAARDSALTAVDATVLVLPRPWMNLSVAEIDEATALARQLGVRISVVDHDSYGLPDMAMRVGGFVAHYDDRRHLGPIFGAMDSLLAGTLRYYRMQFRIKGVRNTFVAGGNAKVRIRVRVPTPLPHRGAFVTVDVPIDS